jgi:hypothetical protein
MNGHPGIARRSQPLGEPAKLVAGDPCGERKFEVQAIAGRVRRDVVDDVHGIAVDHPGMHFPVGPGETQRQLTLKDGEPMLLHVGNPWRNVPDASMFSKSSGLFLQCVSAVVSGNGVNSTEDR